MRAKRSVEIAVFLLAAAGFATAANTQNATCTSIAQPTDLTNITLSCSQFNPTAGELTGVSITITGSINGSITLTNNAAGSETVTGTTNTSFSLNAPLPGFSFPAALFAGTFNTGSQTLAKGATFASGPLTSGNLTSGPLTDNTRSTFSAYEGTGQFTIAFNTTTNDPDNGGGGNVTFIHVTNAAVSVAVVYTFATPPTLTCASAGTTGEVGVAFNSPALTVSGGVSPFTFSVASGTLPMGLTLNTATGAITGTPTATGSWTLQATDSLGVTATPSCPYSIGQQPTPVCPTAGTTGAVGVAFSSPGINVGGGTPPYTFAIVGTLPTGLTLNTATGAITGTPTAAGSWSVKVTDSLGATSSVTCPFVVTSNLTLTCATTGMVSNVGQVFNSPALTVTGGTPPYTFSVVGTLPMGLTLNTATGAITGTPSAAGNWSIEVTDANGLVSNSCPYSVGLTSTCLAPAFQVRYASNLNIGESYIDIANPGTDGAPVLGPGFGSPAGNVCVNVYAFDPAEELVSCCSCLVTPNQTVNLGVNRDLLSRTLTGAQPTSVTVKLVATLAGPGGVGTSCTNTAASVTTDPPACGLTAWGTTLHAAPTLGTYNTTETPFTPSTLSPGEAASIAGRCSSILGNGSGFGVCNSCRAGALGATKF